MLPSAAPNVQARLELADIALKRLRQESERTGGKEAVPTAHELKAAARDVCRNKHDAAVKKHNWPHRATLNTRRNDMNKRLSTFLKDNTEWHEDAELRTLAKKVVDGDLTPCPYSTAEGGQAVGLELRQHRWVTEPAVQAVTQLITITAAQQKAAFGKMQLQSAVFSTELCNQCAPVASSPPKAKKRKFVEALRPDALQPAPRVVRHRAAVAGAAVAGVAGAGGAAAGGAAVAAGR